MIWARCENRYKRNTAKNTRQVAMSRWVPHTKAWKNPHLQQRHRSCQVLNLTGKLLQIKGDFKAGVTSNQGCLQSRLHSKQGGVPAAESSSLRLMEDCETYAITDGPVSSLPLPLELELTKSPLPLRSSPQPLSEAAPFSSLWFAAPPSHPNTTVC